MELNYHNINNKKIKKQKKYINTLKIMALSYTYTSAIAALLNNGKEQVLPISMANLIELVAADKSKFGTEAQSVQDALSYLAGSFEHANTVAKTAQDNAYAYVGEKINKLDVDKVGSDTDAGHDKFISYIYQEDGKIHAFAQDMTATNVAYSGGDSRATVAAELEHINATIADNLTATTLKLVKVNGESEEDATTVSADGSTYKLKQGSKDVASFNIEKDSFVKSGSVVRGRFDADGYFKTEEEEHDNSRQYQYYIKLEIRTSNDTGAGNAESTLYIPAESLVDAYTANNGDGNANSVTVTVDQERNTISAVIKAGGVGTNELADSAVTAAKIAASAVETEKIADSAIETAKIKNAAVTTEKINASAVTTEKIADKNVTLAKLEQSVQDSLGKANSALQQSDITTGTKAGAISVKGASVDVYGLKAIATTGAAADVTVAKIDDLDKMAGEQVTNVQTALAKLTGKVKAINDGTVTSVKTNVVDTGKDTQNAVTISMTPIDAKNGAVTVELTHNLGSAAALDYDMKAVATPVSEAFWSSVK